MKVLKLLLPLVILAVPLFVSSQANINTVEGGYKIAKNDTVGVTINAHDICWVVKNTSTITEYFAPTKTLAEWQNFIDSVAYIPDLSLTSCIQCSSGACCDTATGQFYGPSQVCRPINPIDGRCDIAEVCSGLSSICPTDTFTPVNTICDICSPVGGNGACQLNDIGYRCTGTSSSCGTTNPYNCPVNATVNDTVWNGASWITKTITTNCGFGAWECNGTQPRRLYYGCNTGGTCNTTSTTYQTATSCDTAEGGEGTKVCVDNSSSCVDKCADGIDNDGDGYIDGKDSDCGGCGECTLGDCCDTSTGCYKLSDTTCRIDSGDCDVAENCTGLSHLCPTDSYKNSDTVCRTATGTSGTCPLVGDKCTGTNASCLTNPYYVFPSVNGTIWNGSTWVTASSSIQCGYGDYYCNGNEIRQYVLGYDTNCVCNISTGSVSVATCTGAENSQCINGLSTCETKCSNKRPDGLYPGNDDNDAYVVDSADPDCDPQCTSGDCCDLSTGLFKPAGTLIGTCGKCDGTSNLSLDQDFGEDIGEQCGSLACQQSGCSGSGRYCAYELPGTVCNVKNGDCDVAETCTGSSYYCPTNVYASNQTICQECDGLSGACNLLGYKCTGSSSTCDFTNPYTCLPPVAGNIWDASSWVVASASLKCGDGTYFCDGNNIMRFFFGCTVGGGCGFTAGAYQTKVCAGTENAMCDGGADCVSKCADGLDNDGDDWIDNLDDDCNPNACQQCTSGSCCNLTTGCYKTSGTVCGTGDCSSANKIGLANSCQYSYQITSCSGSSSTCDGALVNSGTTCNCPNGTVWNATSKTCAAVSLTNYCGTQYDEYCMWGYDHSLTLDYKGCNGSGSCSYVSSSVYAHEDCPNNGYCYRDGVTYPTATCINVACTQDYHCGTNYNSLTACGSPAQGSQTIGYVPFTYSCINFTCYGPTEGTRVITKTCAGTENHYCQYAECQNLCSDWSDNDSDGYTDGTDKDCCGLGSTYQAPAGPAPCEPGQTAAYDAYYVSSWCNTACGSYTTGAYPTVSYWRGGSGSCGISPCIPGSYGAGGACYACPAGTYNSSSGSDECFVCPAGSWCPSGVSAGIGCPYGSPGSAAGADSCSDCYSGTGGS